MRSYRFSGNGIRKNRGTGCGIGKENGIGDTGERLSGCGIVLKKEWESGIRTHPSLLSYCWNPGFDRYTAGFGKMPNVLRDKGFCSFSGSGIRQNRGLGCGTGKENVIRDRDAYDRSSGREILVKKEGKAG